MADTSVKDQEGQDEKKVNTDINPEDNKEITPDPDEELTSDKIPTRVSAKYIIERQKNIIEKLRSKQEEENKYIPDEDEEEFTPEARKNVNREIRRQMEPVVKTLIDKGANDELTQLFISDPEAKKFEKRIRSYMKHESYQGVPISFIYQALAFDQAQKIGAKKRNIADREAEEYRGAGRSLSLSKEESGKIPSAETIMNMSDEDFAKLEQRALKGEFTN